ncbi:Dam family site-specific DNA-(adenine-N6)-methyltransferase [Streptococcus mitis]|uniref:Site-specific DNA-methyltransferase (adenine-specific) n=1 Tax=Streptococcus mitis SK597 TaxID=585204 RepID=E1LTH4_STRMT|nr:Dam family site-specific DNA-(adenine-N6)-methyltransferase [Streptococcus mitis]EFO00163.1 modification methylase [Streptococcus mitis SK597]
MLKTQEIADKYGITRQTLNNWMQKGIISQPRKNNRSAYEWEEENEKEIVRVISEEIPAKYYVSNKETLKIGNRRYLGSKQKMLDFILKTVSENIGNIDSVADIFGGTGVVADLFRKQNKKVIVNDILYSNFVSFQTWFSNEDVDIDKVSQIIDELNNLSPKKGYVSKNFGDAYFSEENAGKIDSIREEIEKYKSGNQREYFMLLTSLLYAMDKVANTVGHYDAYRKKMDSNKKIYLRVPEYNKNDCNKIYNEDANKLVKEIYADLVYIDTPYNSRGYENAYHVLENIAEWKKPEVEGVAKKAVNRSEKGSDYTKSKAPQAFEDLILNIDAKYILVSYNNMNKKGNSRSNAKISNEEIIEILSKRGKVQVFETNFAPFTTGKSNIENHKELLYLCTIFPDNRKEEKLIKSALNYTGGKYKLLPQLLPLFPESYNNFIDLFSGGATVAVNLANIDKSKSKKYIINDISEEVIDFYKYLESQKDGTVFLDKVEKAIEFYKLSNTQKYSYAHYGVNSSTGLGSYNKEAFLKLRQDYNKKNYNKFDKEVLFYLLIVFGFNNQIRFNNKGEYNLPVGKRDFNVNMKSKLITFIQGLQNYNFVIQSCDFRKTMNQVNKGDFVYADPPYRITTAAYNENGAWTLKDDLDLFKYLDSINDKGAYFALSNVVIHNNKENKELMKWASKYNLHVLDYHYNNSNYQSKAKMSNTVEVLITNYNSKGDI